MKVRLLITSFLVLLCQYVSCQTIEYSASCADSCYNEGINEYINKNFYKAAKLFKLSHVINDSIQRSLPYYSSNSIQWESSSLYLLGDTLSAYNLSDDYLLTPVDQRLTVVSDSLWHISNNAFEQGDYDYSISTAQMAISEEISVLGDKHYYVANSYSNLAYIYRESGNFDKALKLLDEAIRIFDYLGRPLTDVCILAFTNYSELCSEKQDIEKAILYYETINKELEKNKLRRHSQPHGIILHNLSRLYYDIQEYQRSANAGEEAVICFGNELEDYEIVGGLYSVLASCHYLLGNNDKALDYKYLSYLFFKKAQLTDERIPNALLEAVTISYRLELFERAYNYNNEIIHYFSDNIEQYDSSYYYKIAMIARPVLCVKLGLFNEAYSSISEALEFVKEMVYDTDTYLFWSTQLSDACKNCSTITASIDILDFLNRQYELGTITVSKQQGIILEDLANLYESIHDYNKAITYGEKALELIDKYQNERELIMIKHNLSFFYYRIGDYEKAYSLSLDAIQNIRKGKDWELLTSHLLDLSELLYDIGKYQESIIYIEEALEISERNNDIEQILHSLQNLSACYYILNDYTKAYEYLEKALKIDPNHTMLNNNATAILFAQHKYIEASEYNNIAFNAFKSGALESLSEIPIRQWIPFWEEIRSYLRNTVHYVIAAPNNHIPLFNETAYNALLLRKGFLLNSLKKIKYTLNHSEDEEISKLWKEYINERHYLSNDDSHNFQIADSIENVIFKIYKDNLSHESFSWKEVRDKLKENDVAIEFFVDDIYKDPIYGALVVKKESKVPLYVRICTESQLISYVDSFNYAIYNKTELGTLIWRNIIDEAKIDDSNNIYFSPDGLLNIIAIENIFLAKDIRVSDLFNIHRVSNTNNLSAANQVSINVDNPILLFGGLNYDISDKEHNNNQEESSVDSLRAQFGYLPYSRVEIDSIESIAKQWDKDVIKYVADYGTERAFIESLINTPSIIHLSTHGFYDESKDLHNGKTNLITTGKTGDNSNITTSLMNSGLLFSKAFDSKKQGILYSKELPYNENDNVLTALELGDLDLGNPDLVVLSACQTALGDIVPDGIAGLQRGLKYGGANSIIMSLWKVDDFATSLMMTEFYKELFRTGSKYQAFKLAKKKVSQKLENPFYWAGFIMID